MRLAPKSVRAAALAALLGLGCGPAALDDRRPDAGGGSGGDDDVGGFADAAPDDEPPPEPDASDELPTRVDIVVVEVKFSPDYKGTPWDVAAGSMPDPFVSIEVDNGAAGRGRTRTVVDVQATNYDQVVLEDVSVETLLDTSMGVALLDEDDSEAEKANDSITSGDYPEHDHISSLGTLVFESQLDGSLQLYDSNNNGVEAAIVLRFVPAGL